MSRVTARGLGSLALAALSVGCGTPEDTDNAVAYGPEFCDGTPILTTCPADALTFDEANDRSVLTQDLSWRWSPECFTSVSDVIYIEVPDDTAAFTLTVDVGLHGTYADFAHDGEPAQGPVKERYLTSSSWPPAHTFTMPWAPEVAEIGGCWAVLPRADSTQPDLISGRLDVYGRRGDVSNGHLSIVGVVVDDAAMTEADVEQVMGVAANAYSAGGLDVTFAQTEWLAFAPGEALGVETDRRALLQSWTDPNETGAVPVFFIREYNTTGTIGIAGGVPGSPRPGTASTGVTVAVEPLQDFGTGKPDVQFMGQVVTHELGHQLGLWHVSERNGQVFDALLDTPECDVSYDVNGDGLVSSWECAGAGASNVMFWQAGSEPQTALSDDQLWSLARGGAVVP